VLVMTPPATWFSPAKVNLHLQVVGRRADGYHELRTLFQTVDLADLLEVALGGHGVELEVAGADLPSGAGNLVWRAAEGFLARWGRAAGLAGVRLRLVKRIPAGGGLGGGSSNAATALLALQQLTGGLASAAGLWELARQLGADVPYFLLGGTALGVGRGDEVVPLPELPERELVLVLPPVAIPTAEVFAALGELTADHLDSRMMALVQSHSLGWEALAGATNDLERVALARWTGLADIFASLREAGASLVRLSGSGAGIYAQFEGDAGADLGDRLPGGCRIERVRTLSRVSLGSRRFPA
jgi:4-diphosphocytidyl-2-C-methyl-D-erythritol kinase